MNTFEELGGEVRMNCGVQKIVTESGRVCGVITDEEEEIRADWIVSNADPVTTCRDLIGFDKVPPRFFTKLQSSEVAASTVNVYMGVDRSPEELGLTEHEVFINTDHDFDRHYEGTKNLEAPEALGVTCYNAVYPNISPKGTCIVVLTALKYGEPWYGIAPEHYVDTKNRIGDAMITMVEKVFPASGNTRRWWRCPRRSPTCAMQAPWAAASMASINPLGTIWFGEWVIEGLCKGSILSARGRSPGAVSNLA